MKRDYSCLRMLVSMVSLQAQKKQSVQSVQGVNYGTRASVWVLMVLWHRRPMSITSSNTAATSMKIFTRHRGKDGPAGAYRRRYLFSEHMGAFAELGYGISLWSWG